MASPLLITSDDVFESMGQNPDLMEEAVAAVNGAILRAQIKLEGLLRTSLNSEAREDTFYISGADGGPLNGRYKLKLSNGFISKLTALTLAVCDTVDGAYTAITNHVVLHDTGIVVVPHGAEDDLKFKYLKASYISGFPTPSAVPDGIRQALLSYVPLLLLSSSAAAADPKQQESLVAKATSADSIGSDMVAKYHRPTGSAVKPLYSTVV